MTVTDRETKVEIDILPGGRNPGPLTLPMPTEISEHPQILTLEKLISAKLSTYLGRGIDRMQDYADVVKLITANQLPREYAIAPEVLELYERMWDEIHGDRSADIHPQ